MANSKTGRSSPSPRESEIAEACSDCENYNRIAERLHLAPTRAHLTTVDQTVERSTRLDLTIWDLTMRSWHLLCDFTEESFATATTLLERAVGLDPNCSLAYGSPGTALALTGRTEEAVEKQEIAIRSNPRDPSIVFRFSGVALAHHVAGRYGEAIRWAERSAHRMPRWFFARPVIAASHMALGDKARAQDAVRACREAAPDACLDKIESYPLSDPRDLNLFRTRLTGAGIPDEPRGSA